MGGRCAPTSPRSAHAELPPRPAGVDPVAILAEEARSRRPDLVPVRHGRMLASPLAFLRGAPAIMAADLAPTAATGLRVQLCGDAHVANFGVVAAPDGRPVLDVDELDETLPGPWEWDVKRLAASLVVAARGAGWDAAAGRGLAAAAAGGYRRALRDLAASGELEAWDARLARRGASRPAGGRPGAQGGALAAPRRPTPRATREGVEVLRALCDVADGVRACGRPRPSSRRWTGSTPSQDALAGYAAGLPPDRRELLGRFPLVQVARTAAGVARVGHALLRRPARRARRGRPALPGRPRGAAPRRSSAGRAAGRSPTRARASSRAGAWCTAVGDGFLGHVRARPRRRRARPRRRAPARLARRVRARGAAAGARCSATRARAAGPWPGPTPARGTASRSPPTSARATPSTGLSRASPRPTPTGPRPTGRRWTPPCATAGCPPSSGPRAPA